MIQMLHKDTAGRKSKFLKWQLLVPSNSHCFLDTVCCLYISKNIIPSAAMSRHKRMFRKCSSLDVAKKNIYIYHQRWLHNRQKDNVVRKCSLYVAKNIISSALATQQTQGECSENVPFMSLKTSYHQCKLHSRHKNNVQKSKRNENCYKLWEQRFLPSVLPRSLSSERKTFSLPRGRPKIMLLSFSNSWICLNFGRILMYVL